ncbi:SRPBCC family protein [Granulosicoccus sp.]|nr:SRPBCC family protein [Granulosicoccus sp.]MDB4223424.1 SRPBCC family protein [Granulosicoccus sp.]
MKFEDSITIDTTPEQVFLTYKDVANWPTWDPETVSASIDGDFVVGSTGKIKPGKEPETKITWVEVTPDKSFTVECKLPLCKMQFIHEMTAQNGRTLVVNKIELTGILASIFGLLIGSKLKQGVRQSLLGLKQHLEA